MITSEGGLLGTDVHAEFPCVLHVDKRRFFVNIGLIDFKFFTKSTLMNLCNFAEEKGAKELVFLLDKTHTERKMYRSTFNLIDANSLRT